MIEWGRIREIEELGRKGDKREMYNKLKQKGKVNEKFGGDRVRMRDGDRWIG